MLRVLKRNEEISTADFGGFCPYWTMQNGEVWVADTAEEMFRALPQEQRIIDPPALVSLMQFHFMVGDRTLVKGVHRMPWHSTLKGTGELQRHKHIPHGNTPTDPKEAAIRFIDLVEEELVEVCNRYEKVYLMLTGGLDSRVVAGILNKAKDRIKPPIVGVTWGHPESRDVVFANRIADLYGWEFIPLPYDDQLTMDNLDRGAVWGGNEVVGVHLHNMHWFRSLGKTDLTLAASFGDSIGRAEFSGSHLGALKLPDIFNNGMIFYRSLFPTWASQVKADRALAWEGVASPPMVVQCDLDKQENYMRRQLIHCMHYVSQETNHYQAFTDRKVVEYIWNIDVNNRNDNMYWEVFRLLDERLYTMPWARNCIAPDGSHHPEDETRYRKEYHELHQWLRVDHLEEIRKRYFSSRIQQLNIFDPEKLKAYWDAWLADESNWGEDILKIYQLDKAIEEFGLRSDVRVSSSKELISKVKQGIRHRILKK